MLPRRAARDAAEGLPAAAQAGGPGVEDRRGVAPARARERERERERVRERKTERERERE